MKSETKVYLYENTSAGLIALSIVLAVLALHSLLFSDSAMKGAIASLASIVFFSISYIIDSLLLKVNCAFRFTLYRLFTMLAVGIACIPLVVFNAIGVGFPLLVTCVLAIFYWWIIFKLFKASANKYGW